MTFSLESLLIWTESLAGQPLMLALVLALATFVTEDGALITGSLLVGSGMASASLAISALVAGIAIGDIGLYALGWTARESRFLRSRLPIRKARRLKIWLDDRKTPVLFFSRFLPGTRLPTYLTFGFLRLAPLHFSVVMTSAALVWVTLMVLFVSEIQRLFAPYGGLSGVAAGIVMALLVIFAAQWLVRRRRAGNSIDEAPEDMPEAMAEVQDAA